MTTILRTILAALTIAALCGCDSGDADNRPALTITSMTRAGFTYTFDTPGHWPTDHIGSRRRLCDGMIVIDIAGAGGRDMEWSPVDRTPRDWHNLETRYNGLHRPAPGTPCVMWIRSIDGGEQSSHVTFAFP